MEPWKEIICQNTECLSQAFDSKGKIKQGFRIRPEVDTPEVTQFTCPRCGQSETWGATRKKIAKVLYSRYYSQ